MSVAVCRNVFLFVISVNRKSTKSFLSASRLVTPSVWKGAHTEPVRATASSPRAQHRQHSPPDDVVLSQLLLKPGNAVFVATKSISCPCLKSVWCWQQCQDERLHLKAGVSLPNLKPTLPAWAHHRAWLCFARQTVTMHGLHTQQLLNPQLCSAEQSGSSTGLTNGVMNPKVRLRHANPSLRLPFML